jgi:ribonuclease-3
LPSKLPDNEELQAAQTRLRLRFRDLVHLRTALTHQSFLNENPDIGGESNERMEFLGDSALNYIIGRWLYERLPGAPEGDLTARRANAVRRETLARAARRMKLGEILVMGRGEEASGGAERQSNLADTFEALVGAALVDRDIRTASAFVLRWLGPELRKIVQSDAPKDPKSALQEALQSKGKAPPSYRLVSADGPDNEPNFTMEVVVSGKSLGVGEGRRKIDAQREAARQALDALSVEPA